MTTATESLRLNLGCGNFPLDGYFNVDLHATGPDTHQIDIRDLAFALEADEVRMQHVLEHFPHVETVELLEHVRRMMRPGAMLVVEVPDIEEIMARGPQGDWLRYLYGSQQHEGEFHKSGFTRQSLYEALQAAKFEVAFVCKILSEFKTRPGMPCLEAVAYAP